MGAPRYLWVAKDLVGSLISKFNLKDSPDLNIDQPLLISPIITPITDADKALTITKISSFGPVDPGSTGYYTLFTIAKDKRIKLHDLRVYRAGGAVITFTELHFFMTGQNIQMMSQASTSALVYHAVYPKPVEREGMIKVYIDAYLAGNTISWALLYDEESIY